MPYMLADGATILVMGLSDLIQTKKTQRLKDWGAIEMLLAASIATSPAPGEALVRVWLEELRDPELLQTIAAARPSLAASVAERRPALAHERTRSHATRSTTRPPAVGAPSTIGIPPPFLPRDGDAAIDLHD